MAGGCRVRPLPQSPFPSTRHCNVGFKKKKLPAYRKRKLTGVLLNKPTEINEQRCK